MDNPQTFTKIVIMRRVNRLILSCGAVAVLASCEAMKPRQQAGADPYGTYGAGNDGGAAYGYGGQGQAASNDPYATAPYGQTDYGAGTATVPSSGGYSGGGGGGYSGGGSGGGGRTHVVAAGENLTKIGRRYGVSVDALVRANNLASPDHIEAGKALTIP